MNIYGMIKRACDFVLSLITIIILLPFLVLLIILIRFDSKGPAVFSQQRAGKNAVPFTLYKFRTMRTDVDPFGASPNTADDPRITRIGKFLRETSLDELPQLLNVLKGDMSLVGPRPLYVSQIEEWNDRQKRRLEVKPGLTGLAQVSGRGTLTIEEKLDLDVAYVDSRCFSLDCRIVFATMLEIVMRKDIYEVRYSQKQKRRGQK
jgi:lipopolysaccharide/colanic/teichoic acid biosynthesis glycosyltransferase